MKERGHMEVEDLEVYGKLCALHLEICNLTENWPTYERYELASQIRRSSNSSPAQLAEKNDDRHVKNKIEGVNRSRGEAGATIHHLYMAHLKGHLTRETYDQFRSRYKECVRMLNGLEKFLERKLSTSERRWKTEESASTYETPISPPIPEL